MAASWVHGQFPISSFVRNLSYDQKQYGRNSKVTFYENSF